MIYTAERAQFSFFNSYDTTGEIWYRDTVVLKEHRPEQTTLWAISLMRNIDWLLG